MLMKARQSFLGTKYAGDDFSDKPESVVMLTIGQALVLKQ